MFHVDPRGPESYQGQENRKRGGSRPSAVGIFLSDDLFPPSCGLYLTLSSGMGVLLRRDGALGGGGQEGAGPGGCTKVASLVRREPTGFSKEAEVAGYVSFSSPLIVGTSRAHSSCFEEQQPSSQAFLRQQESRLSTHVGRASLCPWQGNEAHSTDLWLTSSTYVGFNFAKYRINACFLYSKSKIT